SSCQLPVSGLFACVRLGTGNRQLDAALAVARDFSPRVSVAGDGEVLLDVSGLGRLIGEPPAIERALVLALVDTEGDARGAIAPTQTMARVLAHAAETGHGLTLRHQDHQDHQDHKAHCDLCDLRGLCAGACGRGPWTQLPIRLLQPLEALPPGMN